MQRIVVFSDMHGNNLALTAMLEDLRGERIDHLVCLGDAIQGGPQPREVVSSLRQLACPVVMGNADDWLLTGEASGAEEIADERQAQMDAVRAWQLSRLGAEDLAFIRSFQAKITLPLEGGRKLLCFHGSKKSFDDVILPSTPDEAVRGFLEPEEDTVYTGGHTHMQFVRHFGRTFHFNPGSVGFAYRHDQDDASFRADPWAEYAILTSDGARLRLEFRRVPFDLGALMEVYRSSGRPFAEAAIAQYLPV
jgi:predicted phosphodiesterase